MMEPATQQPLRAKPGTYANEVSRTPGWEYIEPAATLVTAPDVQGEPYEGLELTATPGVYDFGTTRVPGWEYTDA